MMETLNAKTQTRLGFWNVRNMFETGKLAQVTSEMNIYTVYIQYFRCLWKQMDRCRQTEDRHRRNSFVFWQRWQHAFWLESEAVVLKKGLEKLIEWKPVNSSITDLSIIQWYAPTNDGDEEDNNLFYKQLQAELMGDMNAKVGDDNLGVERTMGRHGWGTINNNGERLVDFCADNSMVIGATLFPRPTTHKLTWFSPNGRDPIRTRLITSRSTAHGGAPS